MYEETREQAKELIKGSYDLHIHSWPDHDKRSVTDFELLEEAEQAGMAGVLIKNHYEPTVSRAMIANHEHRGNTVMYGSIALNWSVGGLNPYAAESAAKLGAKMIWLPTREAETSMRMAGLGSFMDRPPLRVLDEEGQLKKSVLEIFEVAKQYHVPVSTGHITLEESCAACRAGLDMGLTMVFSHPEYSHTKTSVEDQLKLADMGVLIEKDWVDIALGMATVEEVADSIRKIGAERIYLATDRGQVKGEHPLEGMILFISGLLACGISEPEINIMIRENPRRVLNF